MFNPKNGISSFFCGAVMLRCRVCPPGGAISNMYAMLLARFKMFPEVKEKGMSSVPRLAAFTSEHVSVVPQFWFIFTFFVSEPGSFFLF